MNIAVPLPHVPPPPAIFNGGLVSAAVGGATPAGSGRFSGPALVGLDASGGGKAGEGIPRAPSFSFSSFRPCGCGEGCLVETRPGWCRRARMSGECGSVRFAFQYHQDPRLPVPKPGAKLEEKRWGPGNSSPGLLHLNRSRQGQIRCPTANTPRHGGWPQRKSLALLFPAPSGWTIARSGASLTPFLSAPAIPAPNLAAVMPRAARQSPSVRAHRGAACEGYAA
jgi:hypothetical protein